jgi:hypothetical protein
MFVFTGLLSGCSGRKQVPFGLEDAGTATETAAEAEEGTDELPVGETFDPDQVEVQIAESTLVLQAGYALAALRLDLESYRRILKRFDFKQPIRAG